MVEVVVVVRLSVSEPDCLESDRINTRTLSSLKNMRIRYLNMFVCVKMRFTAPSFSSFSLENSCFSEAFPLSGERRAPAPLMACVSKPMRMKDFSLSAGRHTLSQYSLLKQLSVEMRPPPHPRKHHNLPACLRAHCSISSTFIFRGLQAKEII